MTQPSTAVSLQLWRWSYLSIEEIQGKRRRLVHYDQSGRQGNTSWDEDLQIRKQAAPSEIATRCLHIQSSWFNINLAPNCIYSLIFLQELIIRFIPLNNKNLFHWVKLLTRQSSPRDRLKVLMHSSHSRHRVSHHFLDYISSIIGIQRQRVYRRSQASGLRRPQAFMALIGLDLFAAVPNFIYRLSSREFDAGTAGRLSSYGRCNGGLGLPGALSKIWTNHFHWGFVVHVDLPWHRLADYSSVNVILKIVSNDHTDDGLFS